MLSVLINSPIKEVAVSESRSCSCSCQCGHTEPDWIVYQRGLCADCENGNHLGSHKASGILPKDQTFVYVEDEQGYWHNHVLMAQENSEPIIDVEKLSKMSWERPGAGRISSSAGCLVAIAAKHGLKLRVVERHKQSKTVPVEWAHLPLVCGATGNY